MCVVGSGILTIIQLHHSLHEAARASASKGDFRFARSENVISSLDVYPDKNGRLKVAQHQGTALLELVAREKDTYFQITTGIPDASVSRVSDKAFSGAPDLLRVSDGRGPEGLHLFGYLNGGITGKQSFPCPDFALHWTLSGMILRADLLAKLLSIPHLFNPDDPLNSLACIAASAMATCPQNLPDAGARTISEMPEPETLDGFLNQLDAFIQIPSRDKMMDKSATLAALLSFSSYLRMPLLTAIRQNDTAKLARIGDALMALGPKERCLVESRDLTKVGACPLIVEGWLDVFRLALMTRAGFVLKRLLRGKWLSLSELTGFAARSETCELAATHYLSFNRSRHNAMNRPCAPALIGPDIGQVFLHIGTMKTGSSSLQNYLERNRFKLVKEGVLYPVTGAFREQGIRRIRTPGHARIFNTLLNRHPNYEKFCAQLNNEAKATGCRRVILSSENILTPRFWQNGHGFKKIIEAFGDVDLRILWVERDPEDLMRKSYLDRIANPVNGYIDSYASFLAEYRQQGLLNREQVTRKIHRAMGVERVCKIGYDEVLRMGGIERWVMSLLGLEDKTYHPVHEIFKNRSVSIEQAEKIRRLKTRPGQNREWLETQFHRIVEGSL